jgi:hypothetical protein
MLLPRCLVLSLLAVLCYSPALAAQDRLFVTGDIHGRPGLSRLLDLNDLGPKDAVIVLGDFGLPWDGSAAERRALELLAAKPFTVLFVDGNHENFDRLDALPTEERFGGRVGLVNAKLFHLRRGELYRIAGRSIFVFGGGYSKDWRMRKAGYDWWAREAPSEEEKSRAEANLSGAGWSVDIVLTHVPDRGDQDAIASRFGVEPDPDRTAIFLEGIKARLSYDRWYCGHFHTDYWMNSKDRIVARDLVELPIPHPHSGLWKRGRGGETF